MFKDVNIKQILKVMLVVLLRHSCSRPANKMILSEEGAELPWPLLLVKILFPKKQ